MTNAETGGEVLLPAEQERLRPALYGGPAMKVKIRASGKKSESPGELPA